MANYIKDLQADLGTIKQALDVYDGEVDELVRYLTSPKFHEDTTVQVQDVLNRISAARTAVVDVLDKLRRPVK